MEKQGIGIMSGTSLDGIDLAWCSFSQDSEDTWQYKVLKAETYPYNPEIVEKLKIATEISALDYCQLDVALGEIIAQRVQEFIGEGKRPDFIASHGHTIFHQPESGLTTQIGSGAVIAARTGITTVNDFRTVDVAMHGQGAPLVPIGDELLFGQYDACLNLGGFSNISFRQKGKRIAFDISPCNMALNYLSNKLGKAYDDKGDIARNGTVIAPLLDELNALPYYQEPAPKSLGKEWFENHCLPLIDKYLQQNTPQDCICTLTTHIAFQIAQAIPDSAQTLLITGGGALNRYLIELLSQNWPGKICIPDAQTILYKEAIIFAFLGLLRLEKKVNTLSSVTGADIDNCGGCIWER